MYNVVISTDILTAIYLILSPQEIDATEPRWGRGELAAIFQTKFSIAFSWTKVFEFRISLKFVPKIPTDIKRALVQIMAWHRTGDKPSYELMMA